MRLNSQNSGQMLLITLLVLAVATTIALSLIGRTTTDVNISAQVEESSRAFSAAEAGIEQSLKRQITSNFSQTLSNGAKYTVVPSATGGTSATFVFANPTENGKAETLWLTDPSSVTPYTPAYGSNNTITLCWAGGALEVVAYYLQGGGASLNTLKVAHTAFDPNPGLPHNNNFIQATGGACAGVSGSTVSHVLNFNTHLGILPADTIIMLRLRPLYQTQQLGVIGAINIPKQGTTFNSCGSTGSGTTRCINVYQSFKTPPDIFDYVLYAHSGGITAP
jgi:hypothetical protein